MEAKGDCHVFQFDKVDQENINWDKNEEKKKKSSIYETTCPADIKVLKTLNSMPSHKRPRL